MLQDFVNLVFLRQFKCVSSIPLDAYLSMRSLKFKKQIIMITSTKIQSCMGSPLNCRKNTKFTKSCNFFFHFTKISASCVLIVGSYKATFFYFNECHFLYAEVILLYRNMPRCEFVQIDVHGEMTIVFSGLCLKFFPFMSGSDAREVKH